MIIQNGQTLFDIALLAYGDIAGVTWLLQDNPGLDLNLPLQPGASLSLRSDHINQAMASYFSTRGLTPNSGEPQTVLTRGIGVWVVAGTFQVQ